MPFFAGIMPLYYAFIMLHESRERRKLDSYDNVSCVLNKKGTAIIAKSISSYIIN